MSVYVIVLCALYGLADWMMGCRAGIKREQKRWEHYGLIIAEDGLKVELPGPQVLEKEVWIKGSNCALSGTDGETLIISGPVRADVG